MTFTTASGWEVLGNHTLLILGSSANVLSGLVLRELSFTAIMRSPVEYSKILDSSHKVSFQETHIIIVADEQVSCGLVQGAVKFGLRRCVRVTTPTRRSTEALRVPKNINDEAASGESASARGALGVTYLDNAVLFSAAEHDLLLYIKTAAARICG